MPEGTAMSWLIDGDQTKDILVANQKDLDRQALLEEMKCFALKPGSCGTYPEVCHVT